jgi:hypothetical protein
MCAIYFYTIEKNRWLPQKDNQIGLAQVVMVFKVNFMASRLSLQEQFQYFDCAMMTT